MAKKAKKKKKSSRLSLEFDGLDDLMEKMEQLADENEIKRVSNLALEASFEYVKENVESAVESSRFNFDRTGETKKAILQNNEVKWNGSTGIVGVGFDITGKKTGHVGFASLFLMHGTPRIDPDKKLYNAIFGATTRKKIKEIQEEIFDEEISKLMN